MYIDDYIVYALLALVAVSLLIRVPVVSGLVRGLLSFAFSLVELAIDLSIQVLAWLRQTVQVLKTILA